MSETPIKTSPLDVAYFSDTSPEEIIGLILPRGHAFHGYSSASNERVFKILATPTYSDGAQLLGYGVDNDAELALGRAIATYVKREKNGLEFMAHNQYPNLTEGKSPMGLAHKSKFDNIVWGSDFTLYQDGANVVARSRSGGGWGMEPLAVSAPTALEAITLLTEKYTFFSSFRRIRDELDQLPGLFWSRVLTDPECDLE